jgi:hypothetical protein
MKTIFSFLVLLLSVNGLLAQPPKKAAQNNDIVVTPGVGIGALKLGMSESQVSKLLGGDITWTNYKEEMSSFRRFTGDFSIDSIVQFVIGFDSVATYKGDLPELLPVYSLFFKNHKLNFITITSYGSTGLLVKRIVTKNGLRFYDPMQRCMSKMGKGYLPIRYASYDGDHIYYKEGIEMTYDNNKLTTIAIFTPTPNFKALIAKKRDQLIAEFEQSGEAAQ